MKTLTFMLGSEPFAVPIEPVREILGPTEVTPVPMTPGFLAGIMNLRGQIVPVVDLARRTGIGAAVRTECSCILLVECRGGDEQHLVGALVDSVHEVLPVPDDALAAAPAFGSRVASRLLHGIVQQRGRSVMVLDLDAVLGLEELEEEIGALQPMEREAA